MNSKKTLTKILLTTIGIFFLVQYVPQLVFPLTYMLDEFSWMVVFSLITILMIILLICYFLFYMRDNLADKIIASVPTDESQEKIPWYPLGLRLVCIFAGLCCLYSVTTRVFQVMHIISRCMTSKSGCSIGSFLLGIIPFLFIVILGIYLLCGAPRFVRWQVEKTLQQCKEFEQADSA